MTRATRWMPEVWFWQLIISPHMTEVAAELARKGCRVFCVASHGMSAERSSQGWSVPELPGVVIHRVDSDHAVQNLVDAAAPDSVHLCQGIRANGRVGHAQRALAARGLRQWVVMETIDDSGWRGALKRIIYSRLFRKRQKMLEGVLAIGHRTGNWVVARGMPTNRVFPFAYFLPNQRIEKGNSTYLVRPFRFVFAGRMIPLKRVNWIINVLAELKDQSFELWLVGAGPDESALKALAARQLDKRVRWLGQLPMAKVPSVLAEADCLILPSVHDGWGAVCSESLMVGTPVVCSDACGAAGVVQASGVGGVFARDDIRAMHRSLAYQLNVGRIDNEKRRLIAEWAQALGARAGAAYLLEILCNTERPAPPWQRQDVAPMLSA